MRRVILIIVALAVAAAAYLGWAYLHPNDIRASEEVVRKFSAAVAKEVGPLRRKARQLANTAVMDDAAIADAKAEIERLSQRALDRIEELTEAANSEIESMTGISLRTQDNRLNRIDQRYDEAKAAVAAAVESVQSALGLGEDDDEDGEVLDDSPTPGPRGRKPVIE